MPTLPAVPPQRRPVTLGSDARAWFGAALLLGVSLAALAAPAISGDPAAQHDVVHTRLLAPFARDPDGVFHLLGTDPLGRDVWTRLLFGSRVSLAVGATAMMISVVIGILVGGVAGLSRGWLGTGLLLFTDFTLALPRVVLLLLLAVLWQPNALLVTLVLGATGWMTVARLVHGETQSLLARPFVESAIALGARPRRILTRHLIPNVLTPVIAASALGIGNAIMLEAGLSFLGLGVQPPAASWGNMIAAGRDSLVNAPWVAAAPGIALVLVVVACTLVGDALRDSLAPE